MKITVLMGGTSAERDVSFASGLRIIEALPDVPTIAEAGVPGYEGVNWWGVLAPAGTPKEIVDKLSKDIAAALASPEVQALISRDVTMLQQGSSGVILAWAQGAKDLVVIGATGNKLDYILVSSPAIKKPADLKGKKIAISQLGASTDFIARHAVRQLGLNEKDVTLLSIGAQGERWAALAGGHVDASVFQPPITLRALSGLQPRASMPAVTAGISVTEPNPSTFRAELLVRNRMVCPASRSRSIAC